MHAAPHRRQPLLARPLRRARRIPRPHPRATQRLDRPAARLCRRDATNGSRAVATAGCDGRVLRTPIAEANERECHRLPRLLARPIRRRSATASRPPAPTPARCAPRSPWRCGTRSTAPGSSCSASASRHRLARGIRAVPRWVKEASLRFDGSAYRTMLRNDAYWFSRLGVYHRARRQHRPHPRREVPCAAARQRAASAARSTISSGPRSCARFGADRLSLGLSREPEAAG